MTRELFFESDKPEAVVDALLQDAAEIVACSISVTSLPKRDASSALPTRQAPHR